MRTRYDAHPALCYVISAALLLLGIAVTSCAGTPHPTTQQLKDCALVDIGTTVPAAGETLFEDVLAIIAAGTDGWEAKLEGLIVTYGLDAIACAVKAARDALAAAPPGAQPSKSAAVTRADAFITSHGWAFK